MPLSPTDVLWGFILPALIAAAVLYVLRRLLPRDLASRYPGAVALAAGFFTGHALLGLAPWQPDAHWHWLPYGLLAAALVGAVTLAAGVRLFERWLMYAAVGLVTAWLLVPDWDDLTPPWGTSLLLLCLAIVVLSGLLEPLAARLPGPIVGAVLSITAIAVAIVLALSGNLRMAQIAGAGAGALTGCAMASRTRPERSSLPGVALPFSVLAVGLLFAGRANSFAGLSEFCYLLPPLAPLGLAACVIERQRDPGPPAGEANAPKSVVRSIGGARLIVALLLVLIPLAVAVGLGAAAEMGGGDEW